MAADTPPAPAPGRLVVALWLAGTFALLTVVALWALLLVPPRAVRRACTRRPKHRGAHAAGRS